MTDILIKNVYIIDPDNSTDGLGDIFIKNGVFADPETAEGNVEIINGSGMKAAPGLVDLHVHLRDPGQTDKEDIISGCRAAAAGGVTSLLAMPNTDPAADDPEIIKYVKEKAKDADARVYVVASITKGLQGREATDVDELYKAGADALSDDGKPVLDTSIMAEAMKSAARLGIPVMAHCEDPYLAGGKVNEGEISEKLGVKGMPAAAEDVGTAREIALARAYDVPVHICHVSTKTSVDMIREAKNSGVKVTAETAPHYLMLTEEELLKKDADYRMNPPLRTEQDRQALIEALKDGTIDAIATDHAPHTPLEKADFESAPNGAIGMETSFAAAYTVLVKGGVMSESELIRKMSSNAARILDIPAGTMYIGSPADLFLYKEEEWTVDPDKLHGKSKNTPFKGITMAAKVKMTICSGRVVYRDE